MEMIKAYKYIRFPKLLVHTSLLLFTNFFLAQEKQELPKEIPDDAFIAVDRESMVKRASFSMNGNGFFTVQVNVDNDGNDMIGDAANEPSIAVDPTNPERIVIGWRQFDTIDSNFRQAGNAYSLDGGLTWTFPGVLSPGEFRSDPVLDFDKDGNLYYNSLRSTYACDVFKITDGGNDWGAPIPAQGGDKQWMRIDRTEGVGAGNNYSYWNAAFSTCGKEGFTRSTDGSNTFEDCVAVAENPSWGTMAVDTDGVLYVVGRSGNSIVVVKSLQAKNPNIAPVSWDATSFVNLDGSLGLGGTINPQGLLGQAWVDVDVSNGPGRGNVYVAASVIRMSNNDPGDFMFARSTDGGMSFEDPVRINTDPSENNVQWFGTMSVAPNGRIDMAWLDTRDGIAGSDSTALYFSYSEDQGTTWSPNMKLSPVFDPHIGYPQQDKMGDYMDMVSDNNGAHLSWTNTINGGQDVFYTYITPHLLGINEFSFFNEFQIKWYPNPFSEQVTIEFFCKNNEKITLEVFDILGIKKITLLDENVVGKKQVKWNGTNSAGAKLASGVYFINLKVNGQSKVLKVIFK
ncbi:T9SS type A sorting domain-containing protein [Xanthomarina sp. GH4-25]|uniref:T9SS type A sorting domain-containing protein n=1 Tax=Xanthomarina sp. GH4-25 TaxID=3349335 RepID=UPI000D67C796|nr:hypothetical protein DI383_02810 [Flavobacteriaceae bacterium LYZ1037]